MLPPGERRWAPALGRYWRGDGTWAKSWKASEARSAGVDLLVGGWGKGRSDDFSGFRLEQLDG